MHIGYRPSITPIFLLGLAILAVSILLVFAYFALPRPNWVDVGALSDFPPSAEPYEIREPVHVYVVNDGESVIALDPLHTGRGGYIVKWWAQSGAYIDPSTGAEFDLSGRPIKWADRSLAHYPVRVEAGKISIDLSHPQVEQFSDAVLRPEKSEPDPLDGTRWELVDFVDAQNVPGVPGYVQAVIEFNEGLLSFQAGCNNVGGYYLLDEEHITMTFMEQTLVDCSDKAGVMEVEAAFVAAMESFETDTLEEGELRIRYAGGELLFKRFNRLQ